MTPSLALVIRCFNEEAHIGRLLTGVFRQSIVPDQVVIVDSGSTDATLAIAAAFRVEIVTIAPEDFSFGRALNVGLEAVHTEVAVLASAHVYPIYDTWLARLAAPLESQDIALAYGCQQTPPDGRLSERQLLAQWFPPHSVARQRHPFCNNANAAIRMSVWREQAYDEHLTGLEDLDWAKRALAAGYLLSYVAEAPVAHVHNETFGQVVNRYQREAIAYKEIYSQHRIGPAKALRLGATHIVSDLRKAQCDGLLSPSIATDVLRFRCAQFYGTYRGYAQHGPVPELLARRFYYPGSSSEAPEHTANDALGRAIDYDEPTLVS